jgi:A/G-specific adenine glycosylase
MLQQTRVETVIDYYLRWMAHFPDVESLAAADLDEVLKQWEGLGYYSRARNMQKAAILIVDQYGGDFPSAHQEILNLPGIGPYTAGAIASIAFNQPCPAVDGNVLRVMSRIFAWPDTQDRQVQGLINDCVAKSFPAARAADFTQALMELGALVCTPRNPSCPSCPLQGQCQACLQNKQEEWPLKVAKAAPKKILRYLALIRKDRQILMHRRPAQGLLAGLWEFPGVESPNKKDFADHFYRAYGMQIQAGRHLLDAQHVFTHLKWEMKVYDCGLDTEETSVQGADFVWVPVQELDQLAIPTAFQRIKDFVIEMV